MRKIIVRITLIVIVAGVLLFGIFKVINRDKNENNDDPKVTTQESQTERVFPSDVYTGNPENINDDLPPEPSHDGSPT